MTWSSERLVATLAPPRKPRLLIWADAVANTGFARVTHALAGELGPKWDIAVLGINYHGDPHDYPYPVFPCAPGGDFWGTGRIAGICATFQPDVVLIINDPWNVAEFLKEIPPAIPVVAYMPVDGRNCNFGQQLNGLACAVGYTEFGLIELRKSGYLGDAAVIPHGVDTTVFRPLDRAACRAELGLDKIGSDLFIVGNVNRNAPRKRLDLTIAYFARWWREAGQPGNAYLYVHCALRDEGWDLAQLATFYGIKGRLMVSNPEAVRPGVGVSDEELVRCYNLFDVQMSTSVGEGFGLTHLEGAACGVLQAVGEWSALAEWPSGGFAYVPCTSTTCTPRGVNVIGGVPDADAFVATLDRLYRAPEERTALGAAALACAREPRFQWSRIGEQFHSVLANVVARRHAAGAALQESPSC